MQKTVINASLLSADAARLGDEAKAVLDAGADWLHVDVMDNHYVPNLTMGPLFVKALRRAGITAPIDVHLMVKPVDALIKAFADAGASLISIHPEASEHPHRSLALIKDNHCQAGLVFNPATPINSLPYVSDLLDFVLIMSVNPGFAGQKFINSALTKITECRNYFDKINHPARVAVDGGINPTTIKSAADAGADTFIAGSAIFTGGHYSYNIAALRESLYP